MKRTNESQISSTQPSLQKPNNEESSNSFLLLSFIADEITWVVPAIISLVIAFFEFSDKHLFVLGVLSFILVCSVYIRYQKFKKVSPIKVTSKKRKFVLLKVVTISILCSTAILYTASLIDSEDDSWTKIKNAEVGDIVYFGEYRQSASSPDKEEIAWIVLDKESDRMLLISKYGLDCQPFHDKEEPCTWDNSYIRGWLNDDFINNAFNQQEQEKILTTTVKADKNPDYRFVDVGIDTDDRIFLLSIYEAGIYFDSKEKAQVFPTEYAIFNGAGDDDDITGKPGWWWLRTPGEDNFHVADVKSGGTIKTEGFWATARNFSVRPALWMDIRS